MSIIKGDFLGFTFDGVHSSELGIFRVSDGSRYSENLLPTIQDKTTQIPGSDGTYFQGSFYTQRQINFSIGFDDLSESQLRKLKNLFGDKKIHNLIFDEVPYKVYKVKAVGTPNLKYICFDKRNDYEYRDWEKNKILNKEDLYGIKSKTAGGRIYKGEGQLSFTAFTPYAKSRFKYIDDYTFDNVPEWGSMNTTYASDVYFNLYDWVESSRMIKSKQTKKIEDKNYILDKVTETGVLVYNAGDFETDFIIKIFFDNELPNFTLGDMEDKFLSINKFKLYDGDSGIQINTKLNLIEGIDDKGKITGTIYNKYIISGDFFKIPVNNDLIFMPITFYGNLNNFNGEIDYQYLYF